MAIKLTQEEFIKSLKEIHGDKYNYSLVKYINSRTNIDIVCPKHGVFTQGAREHKRGYNCPKCANEERGLNRCSSQEEVIKKFKQIHGKRYDYSLVNYKNSFTKVDIICIEHGIFKQKPSLHLSEAGCPKCVKHKNYTKETIINLGNKKHDYKYDYSLVEYINSLTKIKIICPIDNHGLFEVVPNSHLSGAGCPKCSGNYRFTEYEIIERFIEKHGKKYSYSKVEYKNAHKKVIIICPKHGEFLQTPNSHIRGTSCPNCRQSTGENTIRTLLEKSNIEFIYEKKFPNCKYKNLLSFDFYLIKSNICIEYNGIQHYKALDIFGGKKAFVGVKLRDKIKMEYCKNNNIPLLIIKYDEDIKTKLKEFNII